MDHCQKHIIHGIPKQQLSPSWYNEHSISSNIQFILFISTNHPIRSYRKFGTHHARAWICNNQHISNFTINCSVFTLLPKSEIGFHFDFKLLNGMRGSIKIVLNQLLLKLLRWGTFKRRLLLEYKFGGIEYKFGGIEYKFGGIEYKFGGIEYKFGGIEYKFGGIEYKFGGIEYKFGGIEYKFGGIEYKFGGIEYKFGGIEYKFGGIEVRGH